MQRVLISILFLCIAGWVSAQVLTESNLPIIDISTLDEINTDGKVAGVMKIYYNEDGSPNSINDTPTNYDGNIGIKLRGQTSLFLYDKKGFSLETRDALGEEESVNLLGMPKEVDWVLNGPYGDKSLMRNALLYTLADEITPYSPRVQMVEIIVNGEYRGVYLFTEKIKRDDSRVDISKLKDDDLEGDELTGGYILKFDKAEDEEIAWTSEYLADQGGSVRFVHVYPDWDDIAPAQKDYIKNWMDDFEDVLAGPNFADPDLGYRKKINTGSFIDFILLNEMSRNIDGYRLSSYMYKDKDSNDDELFMGPVWDYNLAFGNADYCDGSRTDGWAYDFNDVCPSDMYPVHFWWKRLMEDPTFNDDLREKWESLRNGKFSDTKIKELIDGFESQLEVPATRNFEKFPILGEYVWPNSFIGETYESEVDYLRNWLAERLAWMDEAFDIELSNEELENGQKIKIGPNPVSNVLSIRSESLSSDALISLLDVTGQVVFKSKMGNGTIDISQLEKGVYFLEVGTVDGLIRVEKIMKI